MKRWMTVLMIVMVVSAPVRAEDPVYFADPDLEAAVEAELGITDPTPSDMLGLTRLDANFKHISSLTGLEYAPNLEVLGLSTNQISDVRPIAGLTRLTRLWLSMNQLRNEDISELVGLTNLEELELAGNEISDIFPLAGLTNLTSLHLGGNQIGNISPLGGLTNLQELYLPANQVSDISPLVGLTNLRRLVLYNNPLYPEACDIYIPQMEDNGTTVYHDACTAFPVMVPDVLGMTQSEAEQALLAAGLEVGTIWWTGSDEPEGTVIGQYPGAGMAVVNGTPVELTLSQYDDPDCYYVDLNAQGQDNGTSWADAFVHLQDALAAAQSGDQIWVAQGIYRPDRGLRITPGDREASFALVSGVKVYGGFPSGGGDWQQRDPSIHETVLSGDIGVPDDHEDNVYHVVVANNTDAQTLLDGFAIMAGHANGPDSDIHGGGMFNQSGHLTVANCVFASNRGVRSAGAYLRFSEATFLDCRFVGNTCEIDGGGMIIRESSPTLANCEFIDNVAGRNGGGVLTFDGSRSSVVNCRFVGNTAAGNGGGMFNSDSSACTLVGCVFTGNTAVYGGGLIHVNCPQPVYSVNCSFSNNVAARTGGAVHDNDTYHAMVNCILWGNHAGQGGAQYAMVGASYLTVGYSCAQGGQDEMLAGVETVDWGADNITADPLFVDADGPDDIPGTEDDCLDLQAGSPCIDAGDSTQVPQDIADVDGDGDTAERLPLDLAGRARFVDDPGAANTGVADAPAYPAMVDIGAYEQSTWR